MTCEKSERRKRSTFTHYAECKDCNIKTYFQSEVPSEQISMIQCWKCHTFLQILPIEMEEEEEGV